MSAGFSLWVEVADRHDLDAARRLGTASAYVQVGAHLGSGRPDERVLTDLTGATTSLHRSGGRGPVILPGTAEGFETAAMLQRRRREVVAVTVDDEVQVALTAAAGIATVVVDGLDLAEAVLRQPRGRTVVLRTSALDSARLGILQGIDGLQVPLDVARSLAEAAPRRASTTRRRSTGSATEETGDLVTTAALLAATVAAHPDATAVTHVDRGTSLTWTELADQVDAVARGLLHRGIKPGDHLTLWAANRPEWPIVQLAAAMIGAVLVTANPELSVDELHYVLQQSGSVALVAGVDGPDSGPRLRAIARAGLPALDHLVTIGGSRPLGAARSNRWVTYRRLAQLALHVDDAQLAAVRDAVEPDDVVNIQYTSGTTGRPKGAMLTHRGTITNARAVAANLRLGADDRLCLPVPFHHCFGCVLGTLASLDTGAALVIPSDSFSARRTLEAIERSRATVVYGVPTMFSAMLAAGPRGRALDSLRTAIAAGAPVPAELMARIRDELSVEAPTIVYGLTEASPVVTATPLDASEDVRFHTVGRALPGVEIRAVDPDTGQEVPPGTPGELLTRSPMVMVGYHDDPSSTAAAIDADGWLHTGDMAVVDRDGWWRIVGRRGDMIIRGGENIYPARIEQVLGTHPDVLHVAVVGVPDPHYGEQIRAYVQPVSGHDIDLEALAAHCRAELARHEVPASFVIVDKLPTTGSGKIRRHALSEPEEAAAAGPVARDIPPSALPPGAASRSPDLPLLAPPDPVSAPGRRPTADRVPAGGGPREGWTARREPTWRWTAGSAPRLKLTGPTSTTDNAGLDRPPPTARTWQPAMAWKAAPTTPAGHWTPTPVPSTATIRVPIPRPS